MPSRYPRANAKRRRARWAEYQASSAPPRARAQQTMRYHSRTHSCGQRQSLLPYNKAEIGSEIQHAIPSGAIARRVASQGQQIAAQGRSGVRSAVAIMSRAPRSGDGADHGSRGRRAPATRAPPHTRPARAE
jgi:hypothetical protein